MKKYKQYGQRAGEVTVVVMRVDVLGGEILHTFV